MKQIKSPGDLAVNGAEKAFSDTLHVGSPNMGSREAFDRYVDGIFERNWLTNDGPLVRELESLIADYHDVEHCVAMINGTVALEIAVRALELQGEVIIPSFTFIATAHALHWQAIKPVFADISPATHNIDPAAVERMITPNTSGIIGVHLWGRAAPIDALQSIADERGLKLMFDAAHAFGCTQDGQKIGQFGECEILSFHATKMFNTFEGGAVLTNNSKLAQKMRLMRNFGFDGLDNVIHPGTNGKMNETCAAMGLVNFQMIDSLRSHNRDNYIHYRDAIDPVPGVSVLRYDESETNNYHYVVVEVDESFPVSRDEVIRTLHAENVRARRYFWPGCHEMSPYRELFPQAGLSLENTIDVAGRVIVLPTGPRVNREVVEFIGSVFAVLAGAAN